MIGLVAVLVWQIPTYIVAPIWLIFAALDGVYLSSALTKVPSGAWFTLALAVLLSSKFILWRFGKEQQWQAEASDRFPLSNILVADDVSDTTFSRGLKLSSAFGGTPITRINGIGIFFDKSGIPATTPTVFVHFLQKFQAASEVVIFFNLRPLETPTVPPEERFTITRCYIGSNGDSDSDSGSTRAPMKNCYRIIIRHGYNDQIITNDLGMLLFKHLRDFVIREGINTSVSERRVIAASDDLAEKQTQTFVTEANTDRTSSEQREVYERLADLQNAFDSQVVYVVGKEQLRLKKVTALRQWPRRIILSFFLWVRDNTRTKVQALDIGVDKLVEVGFVKEI
jgi:KUP system potassium uptake protein